MSLIAILQHYQTPFLDKHGSRISAQQRKALFAMLACRTEHYGQMQMQCSGCKHYQSACHSCGNRSCHQCQHYDASRWLERQRLKLLPVNYFMVTMTLPAQLRTLAWHNQSAIYKLLFDCAVSTLNTFAANDKSLGHSLGMTAVLHTHSRRLSYHPHVHIVIPGGCLNKRRRQWTTLKGEYLFNEIALARVFRARLLAAIKQAGFTLPNNIPKQWVAHCKRVGKGLPALTYLARYLYRGVISEKNILHDDGRYVTFKYVHGRSGLSRTRKVKGEDFIRLILQHVLPKSFRRVRDFGFLHGNARPTLKIIQWVLGVIMPVFALPARPPFRCALCGESMNIIGFIPPPWRSG